MGAKGGKVNNNIDDLASRIDIEQFYREKIQVKGKSNDEIRGLCPFHEDKISSFAANLKTGIWHCFGCTASGSIFQFVEKLEGVSFKEAVNILARFSGIPSPIRNSIKNSEKNNRPLIDSTLPKKYLENLLKARKVLDWVQEKRGLSLKTIKKYKIGWNGNRNTIPIYDEKGILRNIRLYNRKKEPKIQSYRNKKFAYGEGRIYGIDELFERMEEQIILCFKPDSKILTNQGFKNIKDINLGDKVLTHKGRFRKVIAKENHQNFEKIISIQPHYSPLPLEITENHKVLAAKTKHCVVPSWNLTCHPDCARKRIASVRDCLNDFSPQWIPVKELQAGDFLAYPIRRRKNAQFPKEIIKEIMIHKTEFWFLVGLFLGDGTTTPIKTNGKCYNISFAMRRNSSESKLLEKTFIKLQINCGKYQRKDGNADMYTFGNVKVAEFFRKSFYNEKKEKYLPIWVETLPLRLQRQLIYGLWIADGHYKESRNESKITNTSLDLLLSIQRILLRFGIIASVHKIKNAGTEIFLGERKCKTKPLYNLSSRLLNDFFGVGRPKKSNKRMPSFFLSRYAMIPIKEIKKKKYSGQVYNLTVEEDHSMTSVLITPKNCEGEFDKLLTSQHGFLAVTGTAGAGTFKPEWKKYFKGRNVVIVYDMDPGGRLGAENVARALQGIASSIKNIELPVEGTKDDKDISDYFLKHGANAKDLKKLIKESPIFKIELEPIEEETPKELESFVQVDLTKHIDLRVRVPLTVSGETSEAFHGIFKFRVDYCKRLEAGECSRCPKDRIFKISPGEKEFIESCMSSDTQVVGFLRHRICPFGQKPHIEVLEKSTVREFFATQRTKRFFSRVGTIGIDERGSELVERKVYFVSDKFVQPQSYFATGYIRTHPKTQQVCLLATELEPIEEEYESFSLNDESRNSLKQIQELGPIELIRILSKEILYLKHRNELILAILLTYCSPLRIHFNQIDIRGWMNTVIVGDSGTAKTVCISRLADFIGIGDIVSGLSASRTGITYGLREHAQKGWMIKIGRYPANSRKIVCIDEIQYIKERDIRSLGKAMDEGFLTIDRIAEKTLESMTRLIALANPKEDKVMDDLMFGCEGLRDLFDKPIIRRFDLAICLTAGEIKSKELNLPNIEIASDRLSKKMLRDLIFWAWTRPSKLIKISKKTTEKILSWSTFLTDRFGNASDVPLVSPGDFSNKLARIATAYATLCVSTDNGYEKIQVLPEHVETSAKMINFIYSGESFGLKEYSEIARQRTQLTDYDEIKEALETLKKNESHGMTLIPGEKSRTEKLLYAFKMHEEMRRKDLADYIDAEESAVKRKIQILSKFNLIDSGPRGYFKKPKFIKFLRRLARDENTTIKL